MLHDGLIAFGAEDFSLPAVEAAFFKDFGLDGKFAAGLDGGRGVEGVADAIEILGDSAHEGGGFLAAAFVVEANGFGLGFGAAVFEEVEVDLEVGGGFDVFAAGGELDADGLFGGADLAFSGDVVVGDAGAGEFEGGLGGLGGDLDFDEREPALSAVKLMEWNFDAAVLQATFTTDDADGADAFGEEEFEDDALGDDALGLAEFGGEDAWEVGTVFDEVGVAAGAEGEAGHEVFVVVEANADGGHMDVFFKEGVAEAAEIFGGAGADVGDAVGEEDDAVDEPAVEVFADFGGALAHSAEEGGHATGLDAADLILDPFEVAGMAGGDDGFDGAVVGDEGEDIVGMKSPDGLDRGESGMFDFGSAHGSGTVEDDAKVDRGPGGGGGGVGRFKGYFDDGIGGGVGRKQGSVDFDAAGDFAGGCGGQHGGEGKEAGEPAEGGSSCIHGRFSWVEAMDRLESFLSYPRRFNARRRARVSS